jgi:twitching motility protein PilT
MNDQQKEVFEKRHEVEIAHSVEGIGRFRVNVFTQRGVINIALRVISSKIPTIKELKMPPIITKIAENERGLVLVTGTTGSGKSTTLAAMLDHINSTRTDNIITIEDPIEYLFEDRKSIVSQRELGFDTLNYLDAMRNVVRQDPDVIMLGEMRDLETMATAITAAQTGHLVFSTIHTVDASQTINRIIDLFPPHQQNQIRQLLSDTLKAVISLRLLPHASGHGRVPAVEVLGMQTFNQSLINLFQKGEIKLEDALAAATNPEDLMLAIRGIQTSTEDANDFIQRTPGDY